jgi:hypothetical protein
MHDLSPEELAQLREWRKAQEPKRDDSWRLQADSVHVPQAQALSADQSGTRA